MAVLGYAVVLPLFVVFFLTRLHGFPATLARLLSRGLHLVKVPTVAEVEKVLSLRYTNWKAGRSRKGKAKKIAKHARSVAKETNWIFSPTILVVGSSPLLDQQFFSLPFAHEFSHLLRDLVAFVLIRGAIHAYECMILGSSCAESGSLTVLCASVFCFVRIAYALYNVVKGVRAWVITMQTKIVS